MNDNGSAWRESASVLVILGVLVLLVQAGLCAQSAPATTAPGPTLEDLSYRMPEVVQNALKFTVQESQIIQASAGRETNPPESDKGLPILMSSVIKIPQLDGAQFDMLENPPVRILRAYGPKEFYLRPVRLRVRVYRVWKFKPVKSDYWRQDRDIWEMLCVSASTPDPERNPVVVLMADDPTPGFGNPDTVQTENGQTVYGYEKSPRSMEIACIYYHNYLGKDIKGNVAETPVLLAWQNRDVSAGSSNNTVLWLSGLLVVIVLVIWWMLRRYVKGRRHDEVSRQQRRREIDENFTPSEDEVAQMDPALLAAAEAYFQEHPERRPPDYKKPVKKSIGAGGESIIEVDPALKEAAEQFRKDQREKDRGPSEPQP